MARPSFKPQLEVLEDRLLLALVVAIPGTQSSQEGQSALLQIYASDSLALTYSASGLPGGLSINAGTGLITGIFGYANASGGSTATATPVLTVSDATSTVSGSFSWKVADTDRLPSFFSETSSEGQTASLSMAGTDNTGTNSLTYSASNLPQGLSINASTGLISGVVGYGNANSATTIATFSSAVTLTDNHGGTDLRSFNWSVSNTPLLTATSWFGSEGTTVSLYAGSDHSGTNGLTFSASGLPQGLSINASTGLISGLLGYANAASGSTATLASSLSVGNGGGQIESKSLPWTIGDTDRISSLSSQSNSEGQTVSLSVNATDLTGTNSLTYSASGLPQGLSINTSTGLISGVVGYHNASSSSSYVSFSPTVTLTDNHGGTDTRAFSWGVSDTPLLTLSSDSGAEGSVVSLYAGSDHTGTDGLTYSASGLPSGLSVNASTGLISGMPGYANASGGVAASLTATLSISDTLGPIQSKAVSWSIADTDRLPSSSFQSNSEGQTVSLNMAGTDNTGTNSLTYSASGLPQGLSINTSTGLISGVVGYHNASSSSSYVSFSPTVTLTDNHGGTDTRAFSWGVSDTPLLTLSSDSGAEGSVVSLYAGSDHTGTDGLTYSASGLPSGLSVNASTGLISGMPGYANASGGVAASLTATLSISDTLGPIQSKAVSWSIADTDRLPSSSFQSNSEGQTVSLNMAGTDNTGTNSLTYSASGLPQGLSINASTGLISGVVGYHNASSSSSYVSFSPTVTLTDNHGGTDTRAFSWGVSDTTLLTLFSDSGAEGSTVSLYAGWDHTGTDGLTYAASNLPQGLSINASTGLIGGIVGYSIATGSSSGSLSSSLTVGDSLGFIQGSTASWTVTNTNRLPTISAQSGTEGNTVSLDVHGTDNTGTNSLTYSASNLPQGLSINASTGLISGVLGFHNASSATPTVGFAPTVTLTDGHGGTDTRGFSWSVIDAQPLSLSSGSGIEGNAVSVYGGTDHTGTDGLTYSASGLPSGLSVNASTGLIGGMPGYANASGGATASLTATLSVSDALGLLQSKVVSWTIADTDRLPTPGTQSGTEGNAVSLNMAGTDNTGTNSLTYSASNLPQGLSINASTGLVSGVLGFHNASSATPTVGFAPTVTLTDDHGGTDTRGISWSVVDTALLTLSSASGIEGNAISVYAGLDHTGTDGLTYSASSLPQGLSINASTGLISGIAGYANSSQGLIDSIFSGLMVGDALGLIQSATLSWSVTDTDRLPTPGSQSNSEGQTVSLNVAGTDNTGTNSLTYSASGLPTGLSINASTGLLGGIVGYGNASGSSASVSFSPTVTLTDNHGGTDTRVLSWSITDTDRLPSIPVQADGVGQSISPLDVHGTDDTGTNSLTYSVSSLPAGLSINASTGIISGTVGLSDAALGANSWYYPTVTLQDNHGGTDTQALSWVISDPSFSWSMSPVASPSLTAIGSQSGAEGDTVSLQVSGSDPSSYPLTYAALNLPVGLSIGASTGLIAGTIDYQAAEDFGGTYAPIVIAVDGQGGSTTEGFVWTVSNTPQPPSISGISSQSGNRGDSVSLQVSATYTDGGGLYYDATGLPDGLDIDPDTGIISGIIGYTAGEPTVDSVTVTADDGINTPASTTFAWTVGMGANHAPVLASLGNQVNAAGDAVDVVLDASDPDDDPLAFTATNLPGGLSIDPGTGEITGTLTNAAASSTAYSVTVVGSDGQTATSLSFLWSVGGVGLSNPGDQYDLVGDTISLALSGIDASGASLTYSASSLPGGVSLNASTGLISGTIDAATGATPASVTLIASDGMNSASQTLNWSVAQLALNVPADEFNGEGSSVSLQVSAIDVGGTPTYGASNLPTGLSLNASTGLISGTIGLAAHGSSPYEVSLTATDGTASDTETFVWAVAPEVALLDPGVQQNAAGDTVSLALTGHSSVGTLSYSVSGLPTGLSLNASTGLISGTLGSLTAQSTPYAVTLTVTDGTASTTDAFDWSVSELVLPPVAPSNLDGDSISLALSAQYHGTATLSYAATGLPTGLSLNASTGLISGTLANDADVDGPYEVTATVTGGTLSVAQEFEWDVEPRIELDGVDDQYDLGGDTVSLDLSGTDAASGTLTYSISGLPTGLSINASTGLVAGTIATSAVSNTPATVTLTVGDGATSVTETFQWSVVELGMYDPGTPLTVKGQSASLSLAGVAADGGSLSYSATGLPTGLTLNASTGLVTGTASSFGAYVVGVTLAEGTYSLTESFEWDVVQAGLTNPGTLTNQEGDAVSLTLSGASATGGSLTYSASGLPTGLSLNASTGVIAGTLPAGAADDGPYEVAVVVSDGTAVGQQQFEWDVSPYVDLTEPDDQTNLEGNTVSLSVTATDAGSLALTYAATSLPTGLSINASTGLISGTIATGAALSQSFEEVTLTATDGTYTETQYFGWSLTPATAPAAPVISGLGMQISQGGDEADAQVSATDAAGYTLTYDATNLPDGLDIDPGTGIISGTVADDAVSPTPYAVTVTADDGVGETASMTFQWAVNPSPVALTVTPVTVVEGNDTGAVTVATFATPNLGSTPDEFLAMVDWGDGTTDQGVVDGENGAFTVADDHTYVASGSYTLSVTVIRPDGGTVTATGTETVSAATVTTITGFQEGTTVGTTGEVIDEFTYGNPIADASGFSAMIDPGDGSASVTGTVTALGEGLFSVSLPHGYARSGAYTEGITITDPHSATTTATSTVEVGDLYAGVPSTLTVATFDVGDASAVASSYAATITWGDGSSSSGTVTGSSGILTVVGNHTYTVDSIDATGGAYNVSVTLAKGGQTVMTASHAVVVTRPPLTVQMTNVIEGADGTVASQTIATFEATNNSDGISEFQATIRWGDGTTSVGTVIGSNGLFRVVGGHVYAIPGGYSVQVEVSQNWSTGLPAIIESALVVLTTLFQVPKVATPQLEIEGGLRSPSITYATSKTFGAAIRWKLEAPAGNKGGYIIQHITSKQLGWDYWELWPVRKGQTIPATRQTQTDLDKTIAALKSLNKQFKAKILLAEESNNALQMIAFQRFRAQVSLTLSLIGLPVDDTFASVLGGGLNSVTITGKAYFINNVTSDDLPSVGGKKIFTPGGFPASGILLSAPYSGANVKAIDDFLEAHKADTSKPVDQSLTGKLVGRVVVVTGTPAPYRPGTGLKRLPKLRIPQK